MNTYVISFESTHAAMAASKTLASGGVDFQTIPTPAAISAGCGIAIRFASDAPEAVCARVFGSRKGTGVAALHRELDRAAYERLCVF